MGTHFKGRPEEVRALDAYIKLLRAAGSVEARLDPGLRAMGLTESQLGVLEMLHHLGPLHPHQMGDKLLLSRANITLIVDRLAQRRLVRREPDRQDRRRVTVHLTAEGRRRIAKLFPAHVRRIVEAFSGLSAAEQKELGRLCRKLGLATRERPEDPRGTT